MKIALEIPYRDIDAMGHLNNAVYLAYLETARQKYWLSLLDSRDFWDIDFVVARTEIDYRSPAQMGEVLEIDIHVSRLGRSSFDFVYRVSGPDGRLVAEGKTTQVMYDWQLRRSKPLSDERRQAIRRFEQNPAL
jgi:acyl-CoA thioester hydrolase